MILLLKSEKAMEQYDRYFYASILDMIDSRDYETVCEWLKTYLNLRVISRDGICYL